MSKAKELLTILEWDGYDISLQDIKKYAELIRAMEKCRGSSLYKDADRARKKFHDELLKKAKVKRGDKDFSLWLAMKVEKILSNMD